VAEGLWVACWGSLSEKMLLELRLISKERHPWQGLGKEPFRVFEERKGVQGVISEADEVERQAGLDVASNCQPRLEFGFCSRSSEGCGLIYA